MANWDLVLIQKTSSELILACHHQMQGVLVDPRGVRMVYLHKVKQNAAPESCTRRLHQRKTATEASDHSSESTENSMRIPSNPIRKQRFSIRINGDPIRAYLKREDLPELYKKPWGPGGRVQISGLLLQICPPQFKKKSWGGLYYCRCNITQCCASLESCFSRAIQGTCPLSFTNSPRNRTIHTADAPALSSWPMCVCAAQWWFKSWEGFNTRKKKLIHTDTSTCFKSRLTTHHWTLSRWAIN